MKCIARLCDSGVTVVVSSASLGSFTGALSPSSSHVRNKHQYAMQMQRRIAAKCTVTLCNYPQSPSQMLRKPANTIICKQI